MRWKGPESDMHMFESERVLPSAAARDRRRELAFALRRRLGNPDLGPRQSVLQGLARG